ncbi:MAG: pyrroline-5-carboxylate reductase [Eubacteriales bacterium]|nr:pyrroline-5-carboxylate reductase [Eubacteriales bacterium]
MSIGIVGTGSMGTAIIRGAIASGRLEPNEIYAYDKHPDKLKDLGARYGIRICDSLEELVEACGTVLLAVKPHVYEPVLYDMRNMKEDVLIVTIAVGYEMDRVKLHLGRPEAKIIRTMPNTPCQIGAGIIGYCHTDAVSLAELERVKFIFEGFSEVVYVKEEDMHAFAAISGSMPAFVDLFIEAAADAAVAEGIQRGDAYRIIAAAVAGSAQLVNETGEHPGVLKDAVTSPGGTTIEGVHALEAGNFRKTVMDAIRVTTEKSKNM